MKWPWSRKAAAPKMEIVGDAVLMMKPTEGTPYEQEVKMTMAYLDYTRDLVIHVPVTTSTHKGTQQVQYQHYSGDWRLATEDIRIPAMHHADLYDPRIFPTDGYMHAGDLGLAVSPQPVLPIGDGHEDGAT